MTTDVFKHAPEVMISALTSLFKACLVHGYVPGELLIAKIIPLLKDSNGDVSSTDNYRSICLSSVLLKIWDWIIILIFGDRLRAPELQFGFQRQAGTEICTWAMLEAITYYINRGSKVYVTYMDCTKAFDKVKHSLMFRKILLAKIHPLFVRMLLYTYRNQYGQVCWEGQLSDIFPIKNGVRQGAVISPILFNIYTADLFHLLDDEGDGEGLRIGKDYHGVYGYADDLALLCSTLEGLQRMFDK